MRLPIVSETVWVMTRGCRKGMNDGRGSEILRLLGRSGTSRGSVLLGCRIAGSVLGTNGSHWNIFLDEKNMGGSDRKWNRTV